MGRIRLIALIDDITTYYAEAFRWYDAKRAVPPIHVSFYPYIGINHTIRIRGGEIFVRVGKICDEMPLQCHRGLAYILVGKLLQKRIPPGAREVYAAYIKSDYIREKARDNKREKGRKVMTTSKGKVYDLDEIFASLNTTYFRDQIPTPSLTWSAKKTYRILGHHDATHNHITISTSLDSTDVPRYVVEYVVFHEMLHIAHPTRHVNGRRYNHTPAFKADERKFAHYNAAETWIERNVRKLKKEAKRH
ncbi:MAG: SprT-like domain-containing protein [Acidobacteria bacterium]|nr:SprT-like domain-containing protein [Acidobacteriota bacterium]